MQSSAVVIYLGTLVPSSVSPPSHISAQFVPLSAVPAPLPHSGAPTPGTRKQPPLHPRCCSFHRSRHSGPAQCDPSQSPGLALPLPCRSPFIGCCRHRVYSSHSSLSTQGSLQLLSPFSYAFHSCVSLFRKSVSGTW